MSLTEKEKQWAEEERRAVRAEKSLNRTRVWVAQHVDTTARLFEALENLTGAQAYEPMLATITVLRLTLDRMEPHVKLLADPDTEWHKQ